MATSHTHYSQAGPSYQPYHTSSQPPFPPPANNLYSQTQNHSDLRGHQLGSGLSIHAHGSRMDGGRAGYPAESSRQDLEYRSPLPQSQHHQPSVAENTQHIQSLHHRQQPHTVTATPMSSDHQNIHLRRPQFVRENPPRPPQPHFSSYYQPYTYANFTSLSMTSSPSSSVPQGGPVGTNDNHYAAVMTSPIDNRQSTLSTVTHTYEPSSNAGENIPSPPQSAMDAQPVDISDSLKSAMPEPYTSFPDICNTRTGYALQSHRPRVSEAVAVTVSQAARPSSVFYKLLMSSEVSSEGQDKLMEFQSEKNGRLLLKQLSLPSEPSIPSTSTATPETSTASITPQLGSPRSSITSVSIANKSPALTYPDLFIASPSQELIKFPPSAAENTPPVSSLPTQVISQPTPVVAKSWASLLKSNTTTSGSSKQETNGLPTSSVQGFSIPAATQPGASISAKSKSNTEFIKLFAATNLQAVRLPSIQARGIINLGNMCFANTVLQVLVYSPAFHNLFKELDRYISQTSDSFSTPLVTATITFMKEFDLNTPSNDEKNDQDHDMKHGSFVPTYIYEALKEKKRFDSMWGGQQEDAEEFLGFYLDTLEEELLSMLGTSSLVPAKSEEAVKDNVGWLEVGKKNKAIVIRTHKVVESPISRIFGGKSRTSRRVPGARETAMVDPWNRLQLDIQPDSIHSIEDALRHIATPETIHITSSSRPGSQIEASQQTLIDALPPVLVLHLKRFLYDTTVNDVVKLSKKIAYGPELEIPRDALSVKRLRPPKYKLFGVLNHHGNSATGGHYTLDVLHPDPRKTGREGWIRIDDDNVQNIFEEDLALKDEDEDRSAYLLFYRRTPGTERS